MRKKLFLIMAVMIFCFSLFALALAQEKPEEPKKEEKKVEHQYIGAKKCGMCHKKDGTYPSWQETPHAGAWDNVDTLKLADEKKAVCKACHSTGVTEKEEFLTGVQCEACHGPGNDYKGIKIMKDKELAMANGLIIPDVKTCLSCHDKKKAPEPYHAKMAEKFDFEKMKAKGIHAMPVAEEEKEESGE
jgi:hypothetical protein